MAKSPILMLPTPSSPEELQRIEHSRLRRQLLYDEHEPILDQRMHLALGRPRRRAWGKVDMTANPYQSMWSQVAALYNAEPKVESGASVNADCAALIRSVGTWALMQRVQRDALALREMFLRVDMDEDTGMLSVRPVFPDMVEGVSDPRRPQIPIVIRETMKDKVFGYVVHTLSVEDPSNPFYMVLDRDGLDITEAVLGTTYSGGDYPYRDSNNRPYLPYVLYHAAETGCLFDPFTLRTLVEGSLNIGILLTYYQHLIRNVAWAQRWVLNADVVGLGVADANDPKAARGALVTDPATLLRLRAVGDAAQVQVGQWSSPQDPGAVLSSIAMYERRVLQSAGFAPPDVTRQSADIRSGYSLAVARESIREQQALFEPQFRMGDLHLHAIVARLSNRVRGTNWGEHSSDYRITYRGLPKSPGEVKADTEAMNARRAAGQIGPVSAYMELNPGIERDEAIVRLAEVKAEEADVERATKVLLQASGQDAAPPAVSIEVGKVQAVPQVIAAAVRGELGEDGIGVIQALLVSLIGLTPDAATAITSKIIIPKKTETPPPTTPDAATVAA